MVAALAAAVVILLTVTLVNRPAITRAQLSCEDPFPDDGRIMDTQTNSIWNIFGEAVEGELAGSQLEQELAYPHFWFAWAAFQPGTRVFGLDE